MADGAGRLTYVSRRSHETYCGFGQATYEYGATPNAAIIVPSHKVRRDYKSCTYWL